MGPAHGVTGRSPVPTTTGLDRTAKARAAVERNAALRAIDDPRQLARAARIVRAGLERKRLTLAEVLPVDHDAARARAAEAVDG